MRKLYGGQSARTDLLTYDDGSVLVRKDHGTDVDARHLTDAEVLSAAVLGAVGLRAPAVHKSAPGTVMMEFITGKVGSELLSDAQAAESAAAPPEVIDSDQGKLLGLADLLTGQADRNSGGWIMDDSGRLTGIDNGASFLGKLPTVSAFGAYLLDDPDTITGHNDYTPADMALLRQRLQALQPLFQQSKRGAWFTAMMRRQAQIERGAQGTTDRIG